MKARLFKKWDENRRENKGFCLETDWFFNVVGFQYFPSEIWPKYSNETIQRNSVVDLFFYDSKLSQWTMELDEILSEKCEFYSYSFK